MARVLIVGCGCRGRALAAALARDGHAVRGTSRSEPGRAAVERTGFEGVVADPDRLGTVLAALEGVSVVAWLMGSAVGSQDELAALHGPRLETLLERLVDTPVRGLVYEAEGTVVPAELLDRGAGLVRAAAVRWAMPARVVCADPGHPPAWVEATRVAVADVLAA